MKKSRLLGTIFTCLVIASSNVNAALTNADWNTAGDNLVTVADNGLEWLDLSESLGMSVDEVSAELVVGGIFEGWRYATRTEVATLWTSAGGDSNYYNGVSTQNNGVFDVLAPFWGDTYCLFFACAQGDGYASVSTGDVESGTGFHYISEAADEVGLWYEPTRDVFVLTSFATYPNDLKGSTRSSALVRGSVVPIPSAVWLFGPGLLGLVGVARRKKAA